MTERPEHPTPQASQLRTTDPDEAVLRTLRVVGDRWSILIVRAGLRGIRRFEDFRADLGVARPILTERLRRLVEHGIMEKVQYQDHPVRYEYRLTEAGIALSPMLVALVRWAHDHVLAERPSTVLVHAACGDEFEQEFWCATCSTTFGPRAVKAVRRPGGSVQPSGAVDRHRP